MWQQYCYPEYLERQPHRVILFADPKWTEVARSPKSRGNAYVPQSSIAGDANGITCSTVILTVCLRARKPWDDNEHSTCRMASVGKRNRTYMKSEEWDRETKFQQWLCVEWHLRLGWLIIGDGLIDNFTDRAASSESVWSCSNRVDCPGDPPCKQIRI